ncbi:MAG: YfhO family protein, partial [Prevotella sp.]|nr:YfhO family protein [Prevotella sp.]
GIYQQMGQYWGEQPGTSGPVYVGAFVLMLFVLGLMVVKGPMKWALLAVTILSVMLSWGRNFMPLTDFFIDYVPMYAKFRTVASILVIAEFTIPLLAIMALAKVVEAPSPEKGKDLMMRKIGISYALTAGICVLFALMPTLFFSDFVSQNELRMLGQIPQEHLNPLLSNLREMRQAVFAADCWRSFWVITVGAALLVAMRMRKLKPAYAVVAMALLCLFDLWQVDKRYLNDGMFVNAEQRTAPQPMTQTDMEILKDKSLDYRVLNMASNTFNENETSYYHKSIGGYHAAKLRRYQELIEKYIAPEMQRTMSTIVEEQGDMAGFGKDVCPVLNMLNTKYFILPLQGGETIPVQNPNAYGNAWYVDEIVYAANANEELDGMAKLDLRRQAIADSKFKAQLLQSVKQDSASSVTMTKYAPNHLEYDAESSRGGVIVFSEIYYPGWTCTVDGQPTEIGRVDYVLRAVNVKAGKHKIVLDFHPQTVKTTETVAYITLGLLALCLVIVIILYFRRKR